jgi:3-oxoacyl-[acyl-carrier-protein] synthase II
MPTPQGNEAKNSPRRVVVTGMSAISPVGLDVQSTWESLVAGQSGVDRITLIDASEFSCQIGAELKGFDPDEYIPRKSGRHMAFASKLALIGSTQALQDSGLDLDSLNRDEIGVIVGTAGGSTIEETEEATKIYLDGSKGRLSPFQILRFWPNMPSYFIAHEHGLRGYNSTVCTACASGTQAIGDAFKHIKSGNAEVMVTGGVESLVAKSPFAGFTAMRALATSYNDDPKSAMRPFDADREGFIPAQGSGILILESYDYARARGAEIYAEVLGAGVSNDAYHMIAPDPEGVGAALAIDRALQDARLNTDEIDYINAHATSTPVGDISETTAIKRAFGEVAYDIPISSTKSMVGHMMGATGALEAIICVQTINAGVIHPTINYQTPDPECDLDYVPNEARKVEVKTALSNSFGLGGQNACLILGKLT